MPAEPIDPTGTWSQSYAILAADSGAASGRLSVARRRDAGGAVTLSVEWVKGAGGPARWRAHATVDVRADALGTAAGWRSLGSRRAGRFDGRGDAVDGIAVALSGDVAHGEVRLGGGVAGGVERVGATDPVLLNWQLFDLVQRLPRELGRPLSLTLVDGFELVKTGQRLGYRGAVTAPVGGEPRRLHGFDSVGPGTVPSTYRVDEQSGRTVAAVSGLEAYVLGQLRPGGGRERK